MRAAGSARWRTLAGRFMLPWMLLAGQLALIAAAFFAGAALYVSIAEHPARMALDDAAALRQWKPSYARGKVMQAGLALVGGALALWVWWHSLNQLWLLAGLLLLANWPVTLLVILPVNRKLEAMAEADSETRSLLDRWGRLHAVRAALGIAATAAMLAALYWRW
jgi:hypothetical protein